MEVLCSHFCHAAGWYLWQCLVRWLLGKSMCSNFFPSPFFKGCVVICQLALRCIYVCVNSSNYLEGTVVQCRRWKPCDSSRICVAVVNPSLLQFSSPRDTCRSVILCIFVASIIFYWKCDGHLIVRGELLYVVAAIKHEGLCIWFLPIFVPAWMRI